ncbi:MAG: phosphoenolpyruvate--protein phosphotransferase [Oscillospiraceae bacterium]
MIRLKGKAVFGGIAKGRILFYKRDEIIVGKHPVGNPEAELKKYEYAKKNALEELQGLYEKALDNIGKEDACIFLIQQMIINDIDFNSSVENIILKDKLNADYAVVRTARDFANSFCKLDSEYIKGRSADLKDVSDRLLKHILDKSESGFSIEEKCIICADDLMPSETVGLDKSKVLAICTGHGSATSHTAILARTMNIPAVVGIGRELEEKYDGCEAALDGYDGVLYIEPDQSTLKALDKKEEKEAKKRALLKRLKGRKSITLDKTEVNIYANISSLGDVERVIDNDGEGIGLFRSEFLYLENSDLPDEEYQFYYYRRVAELMHGKRVVIRTLDAGADKKIDYLNLPKEQNPALGMRSIRICLERPEILKTQLRAIYRASAYGNIAVLIPMITDIDEVRQIKELIAQVKYELRNEHFKYDENVELGVMIETPAAVMISDILAREVDFFSIGTNDLEQYTLAIDRQNSSLEHFCKPHHLALLRMMKIVCDNAHKQGIKVCICGELGGNVSLTEVFLAMGVDEFSVTPASVLPLRQKIRTLCLSDKERILHERNII